MIANAASAADLETAGALMRRMALRVGSREELAEAFRARRQALASPSAS
ncbi:MAG: hypothetical protein ACKO2Y_06595 [Actinomycetota bacterium]